MSQQKLWLSSILMHSTHTTRKILPEALSLWNIPVSLNVSVQQMSLVRLVVVEVKQRHKNCVRSLWWCQRCIEARIHGDHFGIFPTKGSLGTAYAFISGKILKISLVLCLCQLLVQKRGSFSQRRTQDSAFCCLHSTGQPLLWHAPSCTYG